MKAIFLLVLGTITWSAGAQNLYESRPVGTPVDHNGIKQASQSLSGYSMLVITPPPPKQLRLHDLVTIIVNETSRATRTQSLDTKKDYKANVRLSQFPSLADLIEARLEAGDTNTTDLLNILGKFQTKNKGEYERTDRMTNRIQAEVIDIKPNGVLVLEARTSIQTDEERQLFVLSGNCRTEDVTDQNTILSGQMHNLNIITKNEGEVRKSARKGFIPRALETLFAF